MTISKAIAGIFLTHILITLAIAVLQTFRIEDYAVVAGVALISCLIAWAIVEVCDDTIA